jgi:predicted nuclease of predicted toxin-antitoxin system
MTSGKARFYADENVEAYLVKHIRNSGIRVEYANELGFNPRDDLFHLQEARRRKCILLTRDLDYLDHREFSFDLLKDTAVVILVLQLYLLRWCGTPLVVTALGHGLMMSPPS